MVLKLYKLDLSPPARSVMMACEIIGIPVEMIDVDLLNKEHLKPEFLKINPIHTVPVLQDGDLYIHDSHAILTYLSDAYGKDDSLYPKDIKKRTLINQKLFFNNGVLFTRLRNVSYNAIIKGETKVSKAKVEDIIEAYSFLEAFLSNTKYLAGDNFTIADIAAIAIVTSLNSIIPIDAKKYPKTYTWLNEINKQHFSKKYNEPAAKEIDGIFKKLLEFE